jgi:predicted nucleic acid-binding protein
MASPVFADTAYYLELLNPDSPQHAAAVRWSRKARLRVVTTEFVLLELGNALSRGDNRRVFTRLLTLLRADPHVQVVPASPGLFDGAASLYRERPDKDWSLVDCASFVTMTALGLTRALTTDRHFAQARFEVLLK